MSQETFELQVIEHWVRLRPVIQKALPYAAPDYSEGDLLKGVLSGKMALWPLDDAFIITELEGDTLWLLLTGGDFEKLHAFVEPMRKYAKEKGVSRAKSLSRLGVFRLGFMEKLGFKAKKVLYEMEL